jgi:hypothetical protein
MKYIELQLKVTENDERPFACHAVSLLKFGFPVDELDFWFIVKAYLANQGQTVRLFQSNLPSREWVRLSFEDTP